MRLSALLCRCFSMRFVAMPLLLTAPLCRRKSSLCFALANLGSAAASLLISSPLLFSAVLRASEQFRCFSRPRSALAARFISAPQLCTAVRFHCVPSLNYALATQIGAFPLRFLAFLGVSLPLLHFAVPCRAFACPRFSLQLLCSSKLRLAFAHQSSALPFPLSALLFLCNANLCIAFTSRSLSTLCLCRSQHFCAYTSRIRILCIYSINLRLII